MSEMPTPQGVPEWTLGWRLQRALAHAALTTEQIAKELGVTRQTISRWTNDHGRPPKAAYVKQWALRCGVPYSWLAFGLDESPDGGGEQVKPQSGCITSLDDRRGRRTGPRPVRPSRKLPSPLRKVS